MFSENYVLGGPTAPKVQADLPFHCICHIRTLGVYCQLFDASSPEQLSDYSYDYVAFSNGVRNARHDLLHSDTYK